MVVSPIKHFRHLEPFTYHPPYHLKTRFCLMYRMTNNKLIRVNVSLLDTHVPYGHDVYAILPITICTVGTSRGGCATAPILDADGLILCRYHRIASYYSIPSMILAYAAHLVRVFHYRRLLQSLSVNDSNRAMGIDSSRWKGG